MSLKLHLSESHPLHAQPWVDALNNPLSFVGGGESVDVIVYHFHD